MGQRSLSALRESQKIKLRACLAHPRSNLLMMCCHYQVISKGDHHEVPQLKSHQVDSLPNSVLDIEHLAALFAIFLMLTNFILAGKVSVIEFSRLPMPDRAHTAVIG